MQIRSHTKKATPKTLGCKSPRKLFIFILKIKIKKTFLSLKKCINNGKPNHCRDAIAMVGPTHHPYMH